MSDLELRQQLVTACHILAASGLNDYVWGHAAVRAGDESGVWMKPAGLGMEEVQLEDLVLVGWDGTVLQGHRLRHAEYPIHTRIMLARPEIGATVHTHAASCTSFSSLGQPLVPISHEGTYFAQHGVPSFGDTSDLILTDQLGDAVAAVLGDAYGAFLVGHGMVTVGTDLVEAVLATLLLDTACVKQLSAMAAGGPHIWTRAEEAAIKRTHVYPRALLEQGWDYLVRSLERGRSAPEKSPS